MIDKELKSIIENKIFFLEKEERRLRAELSDKIDNVKSDIVLLRKFVEGKLDISRQERLRGNAAEVVGQITTLQKSLKLIDEELAEIERVRELLD